MMLSSNWKLGNPKPLATSSFIGPTARVAQLYLDLPGTCIKFPRKLAQNPNGRTLRARITGGDIDPNLL